MSSIIEQAKGDGLEEQIRARWGAYGDWNSADQDQVSDFAQLLRANGITDLSKLQFKKREYERPVQEWETEAGTQRTGGDKRTTFDVFYDGQDVGFLGDINRDGSLGKLSKDRRSELEKAKASGSFSADDLARMLGGSTDRGDNGPIIGWSSKGGGHTNFRLVEKPDGSIVVAPVWGSSKTNTYNDIRGAASIAALAAGAYYAPAGGITGQVATGALQGQATATAASMLSGSGDVNSTVKAGLGGAATGAIAGGVKAAGQAAGLSPTATRAVSSGLTTAARGGSLDDVGRSALFGAVSGATPTGNGIIDRAIQAGVGTAVRGGGGRQSFLNAALGAGEAALGSFFKPKKA